MKFIILLLVVFDLLFSSYLSNKSCKECHKTIYEEYQYSYHSKGYFKDMLHKKIADKISLKKYDCAVCHMPAADNLKSLVKGGERPNKTNITNSDAISCFFCHTIAYVKKAHKFNLNIKARQSEDYKPSLFGSLENPDDNNKHSSLHSPIYDKFVCYGCHSHKRNGNDLLIFDAEMSGSKECIKCHMPLVPGGNENMNKRARTKHHSHYFPGIHSKDMREKAIDLKVETDKKSVVVTLINKMPHPLILQAAREMFLRVEVERDGKKIWSNSKDKNAIFKYSYLKGDKPIVIPYSATSYSFANNLKPKEKKIFNYKIDKLHKGDKVIISFYMILAKTECLEDIDYLESGLDKPILVKKIVKMVK